jgi:bacillithiol biosynthesis cysteine-adding enzyme BshC
LKITPLKEPILRNLSDRYRQMDPDVISLFGSHPARPGDWHRRAQWLEESEPARADRRLLAQALRRYQEQVGLHAAADRSLELLSRPETLVVVGGQQAGLFGGALLIYYKALTVIQAARYAQQQLGRPVVPVFWIAGEDHDFDEANHVFVQEEDGSESRIRIERPAGMRLAVSRTPISAASWDAALAELANTLPDSEYKSGMLARLRRHVADSPTLSVAFARLIAEWFGPDGLVLLDADDPALRELEAPMFRELILRNEELEQALGAGEQAVTRLGLPLQAETHPGSSNLFLHHDSGRLLLTRQNGKFADRKGTVSLSREELLAMTSDAPERLSTNALTRPLMQDYLLPVLGAVLGPSELAYWGVLRPAFEAFGCQVPLLIPRQSFTYLEPSILKLLDKFSLTPEMAITEWEERRSAWLAQQDKWDLEGTFSRAREQFLQIYEPVVRTVSSLHPGMAELSESNRERILEQIDFLKLRSLDALSKRHEASLRQWERIRSSLAPRGRPQERVYGTVHFWNRYGPDWLALWKEVPFDLSGSHRIVEGYPPA